MEEFKKCFETYYVSNFGNVRRLLHNGTYRVINCSVNNRGYKYFQVQRQGKRMNKLVHHLVAQVFIGERPNNDEIDHIDRNKQNNRVENLRYVSHRINLQNTDRYRADVAAQDRNERARVFSAEYHNRNRDKINRRAKEAYEKDKPKALAKQKKYREKNLEKLKERDNTKITCECGKIYNFSNKTNHIRTLFHQDFVKSKDNGSSNN